MTSFRDEQEKKQHNDLKEFKEDKTARDTRTQVSKTRKEDKESAGNLEERIQEIHTEMDVQYTIQKR